MLYKTIKLNIQRFATATKTVDTIGGTSSACRFEVSCTQNSQSVANNTSNITVTFKAVSLKSSCGYGSLGSPYATISIDGTQKVSNDIPDLTKNATNSLGSWTGNVSHADNGTKTVSISCTYYPVKSTGYYVYAPVKTTVTLNMTLDTIARASTISSVGGTKTLDNTLTLNISRKSSSFTHNVWFKFGNSGWVTVATKTTSTAVTYTPSTSTFAPYWTTGNSATAYFKIQTYYGSTKIGSEVTSSAFTETIPTLSPSISGITFNDTKGYYSTYGGYLVGKSEIDITINASGNTGSTISSYALYLNNSQVAVSGNVLYGAVVWSTGAIPVKAKVTDSRGNSVEYSTTINVLNYYSPQITTFTAERSTSDETKLNIVVKSNICNINSGNINGKNYVLSYRNDTTGDTGDIYSNTTDYSIDYSTTIDVSADNSYTIIFLASDSITTGGITATREIETPFTLLNFNSSGDGIGIGKVCEGTKTIEINDDISVSLEGSVSVGDNISAGGNVNVTGTVNANGIDSRLMSRGTWDNSGFTYYQTSESYFGSATGWAHYLIGNHGDGATYYNYMLRLPFGGSPQYQRQTGSTSARTGWITMWTDENMAYKSKDTYSPATYFSCSGLVTTGTAEVHFTVNVPKSLQNISTITCSNCSVILRGISGYLNSTSSYTNYASTSGYTVSAFKIDNYNVRVLIKKSSAFGNTTNNTPVSVCPSTSFTLTFS